MASWSEKGWSIIAEFETFNPDPELDVKTFMAAHDITSWQADCDQIEGALRTAGMKVLLVEKTRHDDLWRVCIIRKEPYFFHADSETLDRLCRLLARTGIITPRARMTAKTASFRLEFKFPWARGVPGRGVSYGFAKRGRLVEFREEFQIDDL
jgi:hypothetical protein